MPKRDLTRDEVTRIEHLESEVLPIDRSADGRPLTPTQARHRAEYIDEMHAILDLAATGETGMSAALKARFKETGDAAYARQAARQLRADELAKEAADFRGLPQDRQMTDKFPAFNLSAALRAAAEGSPTVATISADQITTRDLTSSTNTQAAAQFIPSLMAYLRDASPMWRLATIRDTNDSRGITLPKLTADPAYGGTVVAEGGYINTADPTFGSNTLTPYKFASLCHVSFEAARNAGIPLESEIARYTARELSYDINTLFTTGDGSSKPTGYLTSAINGGTAQGTAHPADAGMTPWVTTGVGFFGPGDMVDLTFAVATEYRPRASYQVSSDTLNVMQNWRDANGNRLMIGSNDRSSGAAGVFNGYQVHVNDALAAPGSATQSVSFGDWSRYVINRVSPALRLDISKEFKFQNDQVSVRSIVEADGELVDAASVAYLVSADT